MERICFFGWIWRREISLGLLFLFGAKRWGTHLGKVVWSFLGNKTWALCMGSNLGDDFDAGSVKKEIMNLGEWMLSLQG